MTDQYGEAVSKRYAQVLVFATSAAVLVLEILAGRLMAPFVGVSLETFTGIIGTILAGIAIGAAVGGSLADRYDPNKLIGPAMMIGGMSQERLSDVEAQDRMPRRGETDERGRFRAESASPDAPRTARPHEPRNQPPQDCRRGRPPV